VRLGEGICGWVAEHRKALVLVDAIENGFGKELERQGIKSALCVPLVRRDEVVGVLNLSRAHSEEGFSKENLKVVAAFAGQLAVAIENAKLYLDLENTFLGTISALAAAVDAKDPYTYGHSSDVTDHALAIGEEMGLSEAEQETLRIAALLHDIGKIGIDTSILNKAGKLSEDEYATIKSHPQIAANILESLDFLQEVVPLVEYHHEWFGGGGYPSGRSGHDIPLGARIIAVADAYNAMTSDRTYREAMTTQEAVRELRENAGTQFDPDVVEAFLRTLAHALAVDLSDEQGGMAAKTDTAESIAAMEVAEQTVATEIVEQPGQPHLRVVRKAI
jgi:putative nucleotidyltransferase with HDIG domain